jgi:hypothetical protein
MVFGGQTPLDLQQPLLGLGDRASACSTSGWHAG